MVKDVRGVRSHLRSHLVHRSVVEKVRFQTVIAFFFIGAILAYVTILLLQKATLVFLGEEKVMGFLEDHIDEQLRVEREFKPLKIAGKDPQRLALEALAMEVVEEVDRSTRLHGRTNSVHEALGIMDEEWDEFRREVYAYNLKKGRDTRPRMHTELIHMAAVAIKAIYCLDLPKE